MQSNKRKSCRTEVRDCEKPIHLKWLMDLGRLGHCYFYSQGEGLWTFSCEWCQIISCHIYPPIFLPCGPRGPRKIQEGAGFLLLEHYLLAGSLIPPLISTQFQSCYFGDVTFSGSTAPLHRSAPTDYVVGVLLGSLSQCVQLHP